MAKNRVFADGRKLSLPVGASVDSGDPVLVGGITAVALEDSDGDNNASCDLGGVYDLSVKAVDDVGNSAVAIGNPLFLTDGDTPKLSKKASGYFFGFALETVTTGSTATIRVVQVPGPGAGTGDMLAGVVGTSEIVDDAITSAKLAHVLAILDLTFVDNAPLHFGSGVGGDVTVLWDGTNLLFAALADDSLIEFGDAGATQKSFDLKWYGEQANGADFLYFDASANLVYTTGVDLQFKDNDFLVFGTGAGAAGDVNMDWDGTDLHMNSVAAATAWNIGALGNAINVTLAGTLLVNPPRVADGDYARGVLIDGDETFFTGGAGTKSRLVSIEGERPDTAPTSGDSYDDVLKLAATNYSVSPGYILRALNGKVTNGDGGSMALVEHNLSASNKSGGTCLTVRGLTITAENYGTCGTEFGVLDLVLKNEGAAATTEYGCRVRNLNNSVAGAVNAAYLATDTGANLGFGYGLDLYGATIQKAVFRSADEVCFLTGTGAPSDGTTGDNYAAIGSLYADYTNGNLYIQTAVVTSPVWKLVTRAA